MVTDPMKENRVGTLAQREVMPCKALWFQQHPLTEAEAIHLVPGQTHMYSSSLKCTAFGMFESERKQE